MCYIAEFVRSGAKRVGVSIGVVYKNIWERYGPALLGWGVANP